MSSKSISELSNLSLCCLAALDPDTAQDVDECIECDDIASSLYEVHGEDEDIRAFFGDNLIDKLFEVEREVRRRRDEYEAEHLAKRDRQFAWLSENIGTLLSVKFERDKSFELLECKKDDTNQPVFRVSGIDGWFVWKQYGFWECRDREITLNEKVVVS
jgi:hypothetical protein